MAKLKRYGDFITGVARVEKDKAITWYAAKYPDGLQPELVLVEPTERRIAHVEQVVKLWLKERYLGREPFRVVATDEDRDHFHRDHRGPPDHLSWTPAVVGDRAHQAVVAA